ncbi:MAG TPA: hypothetical protein VFF67_02800 [Thermoplasmata archaeon]|nr:hypothetical protein [Thermoplasmata archaeon]
MKPNDKKRLIYLATAVAMVSVSAGFVMASDLTATSTTQNASWYQVTSSAPSGFPNAPTVSVSSTPGAIAACTSTTQALTSGGTANLYIGAKSTITCTAGDFAELFVLTSSATAAAGNYVMTVFDSYGAGPTTGTGTATVNIASALTSSGTVNVYVDFGTAMPPAGGIGELDLIVS